MKVFFEVVGRVICFALLVAVVAVVRHALAPKPVTFAPAQLDAYRALPTYKVQPSWTDKGLGVRYEWEKADAVQKALKRVETDEWKRPTAIPAAKDALTGGERKWPKLSDERYRELLRQVTPNPAEVPDGK